MVEGEESIGQPMVLDFGVARTVHSAAEPGSLYTMTSRVTLSDGLNSPFDNDGSSFPAELMPRLLEK